MMPDLAVEVSSQQLPEISDAVPAALAAATLANAGLLVASKEEGGADDTSPRSSGQTGSDVGNLESSIEVKL